MVFGLSVSVTTGCQFVKHEIEVIHSDDCIDNIAIYVPNTFSPNGDYVNDLFTVAIGSDLDVTGIQCLVYDRWGGVVYETKTLPVSWDGRFRGEMMNPGVYIYLIHLDYMTGGEEKSRVISGDITVIR